MAEKTLALHETLQIHELLNFKTVCMATAKAMEGVVFDQDLKALFEKDVQQSLPAVKELQELLAKAPLGETRLEEGLK
ncbi:spore coat protein [Clostridium swellfunianum]|uniref:spore coat protein n=1 Tax=Clostridium swellfunianum TaxID=1367462 RepID=UPI00202E61FB|nr:spore coat protein [Clostridium swellfunianum]MCM0647802.1 spore coat protein [Clostridium swellfunianum]